MSPKPDIAVAVYDLHTQAETGVKALQRAGFDMKKVSIIGKDYHTEEHIVGFLNAGDRAKIFGKLGTFWGGLSALAGALMAVGIPKDSVLRYETALKANKFMLVVHGDGQQIMHARELLQTSGLASFDHHAGEGKVHPAVHA